MSKEINSGSPARGKSPASPIMGHLTPSEIVERGRKARDGRFVRLKEKKPERVVKTVEATPLAYRDRLVKALIGNCSAKVAIRAHCEQCVGYEEVKVRVGECKAFGCALHFHRPYQEKTKQSQADEIPW